MYKWNTSKTHKGYVAPVLGNGTMTFQADYEGTMQSMPDLSIKSNMDLRIWQAGRRYMHKSDKDLISYGFFGQRAIKNGKESVLKETGQTLDTKNALMHTACSYENDVNIKSEIFIHYDYNLIAVKKEVYGTEEFYFDYNLADIKLSDKLPELMTIKSVTETPNGVEVLYTVAAGMYPYEGIICVFGANGEEITVNGNRFSLSSASGGEFYILFCDNLDCENYTEHARKLKDMVIEQGYEKIREEHCRKWNEYMSEGFAVIDDELINKAYNTAQYHLKCYTTKWSIPVGLNNGSWQGRYFAFDEFYMMMGLLTSNHMSGARKVPQFRFDGLETALFRCGTNKHEHRGVMYPWETLENGTEGGPSGFWLDHVFHMACISCGAYFYYKFNNDRDFLENIAYPIIKNSALYYINHMVYTTENGRVIVGKCTDLERLGPHRENPYMTTCGVIKTLQIFAEISAILGCDGDFAKECTAISEKLLRDLPHDGEKYIPYADSKETSIGLLGGTYPFDVISRDSKLQEQGINSYLDSESVVGNMYAVGTGVCSWYMTWKAVVFARMNKCEETAQAIRNAAKNSGYFGEMYEINDTTTNTIFRPWFTTAAGMLVHSVNEMLLTSDEDAIYIAPALSESIKDFSFKLSAYNDLCVEVEVKNNKIEKLRITDTKNNGKKFVRVFIPEHILTDKNIGAVREKNILIIETE